MKKNKQIHKRSNAYKLKICYTEGLLSYVRRHLTVKYNSGVRTGLTLKQFEAIFN